MSQLSELRTAFPDAKNIMLLTGKESYAVSGAKTIVDAAFANDIVVKFNDCGVNPKIEVAQRGVELARESEIDLIIAVGGGSVIDMGKLIKAFYATPDRSYQIARGEIALTDPGIPLIAVPTTAGSGSEATHFAVVYLGLEKFSLASPYLLPESVILDGKLIATGSAYQKACSGLDTLAQAIESAWAVGSTSASRVQSFQALRLCTNSLKQVVEGQADDLALQSMMNAANLAGRAINVAKTTAAHAWSYGITSHHGVPHGHAVWLTLPTIFQMHAQAHETHMIDTLGLKHLQGVIDQLMQIMSIPSADQSASILRGYMAGIGLETQMSAVGADNVEKRRFLSKHVNIERMSNNPIVLGENEISQIFDL